MHSFEKIPAETENEKNLRFAQGNISEQEMREYRTNPDRPLFEYELKKNDKEKIKLKLWAFAEKFKNSAFENMRDAWGEKDKVSADELEEELEMYFEQEKAGHPFLYNSEYFIITDEEEKPFAITGITTTDIQGGAGLRTRDSLDLSQHNLVANIGWYAVNKKYQKTGIGGFLLDWTENMARARGANIVITEVSDFPNEESARRLYEKRGYKEGLNVKDFFGPGRDLFTCVAYLKNEKIESFEPEEKINQENREEVLALAKRIYSPERYKEFEVCLDLLAQQIEGEPAIEQFITFILRDLNKQIKGFSVMSRGVYENVIFTRWEGSDPDIPDSKKSLVEAIKGSAVSEKRGIVVIHKEGRDDDFFKEGFQSCENGIGPDFYEEGDVSKFLLYSKRL